MRNYFLGSPVFNFRFHFTLLSFVFFITAAAAQTDINRCLVMPVEFPFKPGDDVGMVKGKKFKYDPVYCFQVLGNTDYHARQIYQDVWKNASVDFKLVKDTNRFSQRFLANLSFSPVLLHTRFSKYQILKVTEKKQVLSVSLSYQLNISISSNRQNEEELFSFQSDTVIQAQSYRDAAYIATLLAYKKLALDSVAVKQKINKKFVESVKMFAGEPFLLSKTADNMVDLKESLKRAKESVWTIETKNSLGSGVCVDPRGFLVTNYHVVDEVDSVTLINNQKKTIKAKVIKRNPLFDLALLEMPTGNYPFLSFQRDSTFEDGENVYAVGTPFSKELAQTVSKGIISGTRDFYARKYLQIDVPINPGNSGGPLINEKGIILGIVCSRIDPDEANSIGFAIPSHIVFSSLNLK